MLIVASAKLARKNIKGLPISAQCDLVSPGPTPLSVLLELAESSESRGALTEPKSETPLFMHHLGEQFAEALANEKLETALSMLAGCPSLATMPCRKALFSALHWSCASERLAPATRALLVLGADPMGFPLSDKSADHASNTPLRWAVSSGNLPSLQALLRAGARPELADLHEACRNAQGACAMALLDARPDLDPFASIHDSSCHQALVDSAKNLRSPIEEKRLHVDEALAQFERIALNSLCPAFSVTTERDDERGRRL